MTPEEPIMYVIEPLCVAFFATIKEAKKAHGRTNQDIADATGIPLSNISKFFSGNLANPNIYNAAAVCKYLDVSIDEAFDLKRQQQNESDLKRITELEGRIKELEIHLDYVKQDRSHLEESLKSRKVIIAVLFGLCILMTASIGIGIIYDSIRQDEGFIQAGTIAPISIMCITTVVIAIAVTIVIIGKNIYKKQEKR